MYSRINIASMAKSPSMEQLPRSKKAKEKNTDWCTRAAEKSGAINTKEWTYVLLLGGTDVMSFRLRVAQSQLRSDLLPSFWSESLLLNIPPSGIGNAKVIHVPLMQPAGENFATSRNGVVETPLSAYADAETWPNIALIALPVPQKNILNMIKRFKESRSPVDALEHSLRWLAFAWGVSRSANPILDGMGLPSACMLDTVFSAARFDLTPGVETSLSCPEAIWSAAMRWNSFYEKNHGTVPKGCFVIDHKYGITEEPRRAPR